MVTSFTEKKMMADHITRKEVEEKLAKSGDFVKMDFLQNCLKRSIDFDTKRFCMLKLAGIYESRKMFLESGKLMRNVADINTTFDGKYSDFTKSMELLVKAGDYTEADLSYKKALACGNEKQKIALRIKLKDIYKSQARDFMTRDKRRQAMEVYEQMLTLSLDTLERKDVNNQLLQLYHKLGKIREYYSMQRNLNSPPQQKPEEKAKPLFGTKSIEVEDEFDLDDILK